MNIMMNAAHESTGTDDATLYEPVRNHYYYGKLLSEYHFELETTYFNRKRWVLNQTITGYGVVCGLDVIKSKGQSLMVKSGMAIDRHGREIVVPSDSMHLLVPVDMLPDPADDDCDSETYLHLVLCYHECLSDPAPVLSGHCKTSQECVPGSIRERYRLEFRSGQAEPPAIDIEGRFPDVINQKGFNYSDLVDWVTAGCVSYPEDPCIPLADICFVLSEDDDGARYEFEQDGIDIYVRPVVYSNDMLFNLLISSLVDRPSYRRGK